MSTEMRINKKKNPYVMIDNSFFEDASISWKAKGLMGYILSRPENWKFNHKDLVNRSKDGKDAVTSALQELQNAGYIHYYQERVEDGQFGKWIWEIYESPNDNPHTENPHTVKPHAENTDINNTNINNTDLNKKNNIIKIDREIDKAIDNPNQNWIAAYKFYIGEDEYKRLSSAQKSTIKKFIINSRFEEALVCELIEKAQYKENKFQYISTCLVNAAIHGINTLADYKHDEFNRKNKS